MLHLPTPAIDHVAAARRIETEHVFVLDVREQQEFDAGRIPSAVHIPMRALVARIGEVPTDRPVIVVCRSGARSDDVTRYLNQLGIDAVNLSGGTGAWHRAKLPLDPPDGRVL